PLLCSNLRSSEMESAMRGSKTILWSVWIILTISLIACGGRRRTGDVIDDTDTSGDLNNDVDLGELPDGAECFEGTSQCSMDATRVEDCIAGMWNPGEMCEFGCNAGACLTEVVEGTCASPVALTLGETARGSTADGLASNVWSDACTMDYGFAPSGPDVVYTLDVTQPTWVEIEVF